MAIRIEHRFLDRLLPVNETITLQCVIIGTFNPAAPIIHMLTSKERKEFADIEKTKRYYRMSQVKNFYDRPQNRFWKIMDIIRDPAFYESNNFKIKNLQGVKYYMNTIMSREEVFDRQQMFCRQNGIFITDLVRAIEPASFKDIYARFPDKAIERAKCEWNTSGISTMIDRYKPLKILVNLKLDEKSLPKISEQIETLKKQFGCMVTHVDSTSGSAGNSYLKLANSWKQHF